MADPVQKSVRRHNLKEVDRKWKPTLARGKEMANKMLRWQQDKNKEKKMAHHEQQEKKRAVKGLWTHSDRDRYPLQQDM